MTDTHAVQTTPFAPDPERASDEPALIVDVEGFEGPLDLLLLLARERVAAEPILPSALVRTRPVVERDDPRHG